MSISEAPPSSFDINNSTTHPKSTDPNAASSSATTTTTTNNSNDDHGKTFALVSKSIHQDLISMKEYMEQVNMQINHAYDKFEELQTRGSSEAELYELRKAVTKLKSKIPSQLKISSPDSILHRNPWPDVNKASAEMMGNLDKKFEHTINDSEGLTSTLVDQVQSETNEITKGTITEFERTVASIGLPLTDLELLKLSADQCYVTKMRRIYMLQFPHQFPEVSKYSTEMMGNLEKEFKPTINDHEGLRAALSDLPYLSKLCLLSFFRFPEMATIMRSVIIYWWIAEGFLLRIWIDTEIERFNALQQDSGNEYFELEEDIGNEIFEELITKGLVEPVYQKCSLVPDSCRMSPLVRSILTTEAERYGFTSFYTLGQDTRVLGQDGYSCLNNVSEAVIYGGPELCARMKHVNIAYLGRWHSLASHSTLR